MPTPTPPSGYRDFYELELKINYNNSPVKFLQGSSVLGTTPEERQVGWTETYQLYLPTAPSGSDLPLTNAYALVQARASLLGLNFYIKSAICHQASLFKSSWPMAFAAKYGTFDAQDTGASNTQACSSPEETLILRLEAGTLYRWEHQIRGLKDYLVDDAMTYFPATSYSDGTPDARYLIFDALQTPLPNPAFNGFVDTTVNITAANGSVTGITMNTPGTYPGVSNGTYDAIILGPGGTGSGALGSVSITGGTASSVGFYAGYGGAGYVTGLGSLPARNDPNALPNYLPASTYWSNFMSCLLSYTQSGPIRRIAQSTYTVVQPTFPSGLAPAILGVPNKANRALYQRVGNRQTGQIRLTKKARVRRGI